MNKGIMFQDGEEKRIDFVLVWEVKAGDPSGQAQNEKRKIFQDNLQKEGLELEVETREDCDLNFLKIHAPKEVLRRYAEILKIRMPIRKFMDELLEAHAEYSGAEGDNMLEFKLTQVHSFDSQSPVEQVKIPLVGDMAALGNSLFEKLREPFLPSPEAYARNEIDYTATYSRDKDYLFDHDNERFFSPSTRSRIIEFILKRKRFSNNREADFAFGIERLIGDGTYIAAYPLHDGTLKTPGSKRNLLAVEWASLRKSFMYQPLDAIKDYFGIKIALYFTWLGFYTNMLIVPSIVGLFCFLYGLLTMSADTTSDEICEGSMANVSMCPICDNFCTYWPLKDSCYYYRVRYLFDNETTVFFAVFMSLWAVFFLELWKRYSAEISHRWDVFGYDPEEEHPRPEYLEQLKNVHGRTINFITGTAEPRPPFWKMKFPGFLISVSSVVFMIGLALSAVFAVVLYRMSMIVALAAVKDNTIKGNWSIFISVTGAAINLVLILIFNYFYEMFALWLTEKELQRTQAEFDDSLAIKIYFLQFVNYYGSIFYIAFVKGQFIGRPDDYNRWAGFRQEECSPGGCFMELCLQLMVIFVGKQFFIAAMEYYLPLLWQLFNVVKLKAWHAKEDKDSTSPQYVQDFKLVEWGQTGLFYEYLEMVLQYGFITIFVTAFPLAPLFALANNILELRFDAKKLLRMHRRPVAQKVKDIGIWYDIMESLGRIAVITNAFIIAISSDFIPKQVFKYLYSENTSYDGYANFSLSYFSTTDFDKGTNVNWNISEGVEPQYCRYPAYRNPPWEKDHRYELANAYWIIWGARLLFVVIFQDLVALTMMAVRWIIPDIPQNLKDKIRREAYITNEIIIRTERYRAQGLLGSKKPTPVHVAKDPDPTVPKEEQENHTTSFIENREPENTTSFIEDVEVGFIDQINNISGCDDQA